MAGDRQTSTSKTRKPVWLPIGCSLTSLSVSDNNRVGSEGECCFRKSGVPFPPGTGGPGGRRLEGHAIISSLHAGCTSHSRILAYGACLVAGMLSNNICLMSLNMRSLVNRSICDWDPANLLGIDCDREGYNRCILNIRKNPDDSADRHRWMGIVDSIPVNCQLGSKIGRPSPETIMTSASPYLS